MKKDDKLGNCLVIKREEMLVNRKQHMCVVFRHNDFPNKELHIVERFCQIITEGPATEFFTDKIDEMIKDVMREDRPVAEAEENAGEDTATESIDRFRAGGEINAVDVTEANLVVKDKNLPLAENMIEEEPGTTIPECQYGKWGHSGICYRRQQISTYLMPALKIQIRSNEVLTRRNLFEYLFITDYVKDVIINNINTTIVGDCVTYGEFLWWLGLWFLCRL
jgi:hypothetical protein